VLDVFLSGGFIVHHYIVDLIIGTICCCAQNYSI
jgi:hypothetical protein